MIRRSVFHRLMETRFLAGFVWVVELGSIASAARRLDLTPASVAQQLRALEAEIGSRLVERAGRTVRPTIAGTRVLAHARSVLREVRDLQSAASQTSLPAGPLRLGTTPTGLTGLLPPVLRAWTRRYPQIEIYIEPATTALLQARVMAGELDAALMVHPLYELPKTCLWREWRREKMVLVTPSSMKVTSPLETVIAQPFILYDRKVTGGKLAADYVRAKRLRPRVRFELDGIEAIANLVAEGLGVSILPDWPVIGRSAPDVKRWPLPGPCPVRRIGLLSMRQTVREPLVAEFARLANEVDKARN
jgi:DNA-binding transcriptional LysR family regulator